MKIKTYAVNCNDAWLNTEGDDISGSYVKYKDHQEVVSALEAKCAALAAENAALSNIDKQALNEGQIEWLKKLADMEYCKSNPGHWLMSLKDTNMLAKLALRSVALLDELEAAENRIAELEALEVKLPDVEKWRSPEAVRAQSAYRALVGQGLSAAGIITKVGE